MRRWPKTTASRFRLNPVPRRAARTYPMRLDGVTLYELIDTPGFQRAREVLAWLNAHDRGAGARTDVVREFVTEHDDCRALPRRMPTVAADSRRRRHPVRGGRQPTVRRRVRTRNGSAALDRPSAHGADQHDRQPAITSTNGARRCRSSFRSCACSTQCTPTSTGASICCARSAPSTKRGSTSLNKAADALAGRTRAPQGASGRRNRRPAGGRVDRHRDCRARRRECRPGRRRGRAYAPAQDR